ASDVGPEGRLFDAANLVYLLLIAGLVVIWLNRNRTATKNKQKPTRSSIAVDGLFLLGILVLSLIVYFRYSGGRDFFCRPGVCPRRRPDQHLPDCDRAVHTWRADLYYNRLGQRLPDSDDYPRDLRRHATARAACQARNLDRQRPAGQSQRGQLFGLLPW